MAIELTVEARSGQTDTDDSLPDRLQHKDKKNNNSQLNRYSWHEQSKKLGTKKINK